MASVALVSAGRNSRIGLRLQLYWHGESLLEGERQEALLVDYVRLFLYKEDSPVK